MKNSMHQLVFKLLFPQQFKLIRLISPWSYNAKKRGCPTCETSSL